MNRMSVIAFAFAVPANPADSFAQSLDECPAKRYKECPAFRTSRTIQVHSTVGGQISGYTRSKGKWEIVVGYGPPETCAKVSLFLGMGPLDGDRRYDHVFHRGGGVISDSGSFMHQVDEVETGLRIHNATCRIPDSESARLEADPDERQALEDQREHLALEEERERLALEAEQERLALEAERQRR